MCCARRARLRRFNVFLARRTISRLPGGEAVKRWPVSVFHCRLHVRICPPRGVTSRARGIYALIRGMARAAAAAAAVYISTRVYSCENARRLMYYSLNFRFCAVLFLLDWNARDSTSFIFLLMTLAGENILYFHNYKIELNTKFQCIRKKKYYTTTTTKYFENWQRKAGASKFRLRSRARQKNSRALCIFI